MKTLKDKDYDLLEQIVSLKCPLLLKAMTNYLKKTYKDVVMTRDYVYAKGNIPVALVAHLDTVFKTLPSEIYYDQKKGVIWSPQGLGADDRAGVFAIIKVLQSGLRPHVIFTTGEEVGGIGAEALVTMEKDCPFNELKYIIELDRRGTNDCVFYDCDNSHFVKYVESFGFCEAIGSFSDISEICPAWGVAGVNLSIGYENEHSNVETLHIAPMLDTIDKVQQMLAAADSAPFFEWVPSKWYKKYSSVGGSQWNSLTYPYSAGWDDDYGYSYGLDEYYYSLEPILCDHCGKEHLEYEMFPIKMLDGTTEYYCSDCIVTDKIDWCVDCGEAFEKDPAHPNDIICNDCKAAEAARKAKIKEFKGTNKK